MQVKEKYYVGIFVVQALQEWWEIINLVAGIILKWWKLRGERLKMNF